MERVLTKVTTLETSSSEHFTRIQRLEQAISDLTAQQARTFTKLDDKGTKLEDKTRGAFLKAEEQYKLFEGKTSTSFDASAARVSLLESRVDASMQQLQDLLNAQKMEGKAIPPEPISPFG